jgi:plastocyanin
MRRLIVIPLAVLAVSMLAAVALASGTRSVKVADNFFIRPGAAPTIHVSAGTRIVWQWRSVGPHNVTVSSGPVKFHSVTQYSGTFSRKLTARGTYRIYCTIHPGMKMTVKVN